MSDAYVGQILSVAFGFAPPDWAFCAGQALPNSQYEILLSLIGTTYGGSGNTFNLPDLRGRRMVGAMLSGTSPLPSLAMGDVGGALGTVIPVSQHTHVSSATPAGVASTTARDVSVSLPLSNVNLSLKPALVSKDGATSDAPIANGMIADATCSLYGNASTNTVQLAPTTLTGTATGQGAQNNSFRLPVSAPITVSPAGSANAIWPPSPYVAVANIICVNGIYPSRP
jgi:microcystin-dependent protein